jgi:hypothetical protein
MTITCTATFRQGHEHQTWDSTGSTLTEALSNLTRSAALSHLVGVGNGHAGIRLLMRYELGHRPSGEVGDRYLKDEGAYLSVTDDDQPEVSIGWVTFTFASPPPVY